MSVRTRFAFPLALALTLVFGARAWAQAEIADAVSMTATVASVDLATRTVELKGADGKTTTVVVPESIANLYKLKVGTPSPRRGRARCRDPEAR
jgi:hypothetical protein